MKRKYKVKRDINGPKNFRDFKKWSEGDWIVGELVGYHTDNYGKTCWKIRIEDGEFKDGTIDKFMGKVPLVLNYCGHLEKAMADVEMGEMIQAEYQGTNTIQEGTYKGKESHLVSVQVVEEDDEIEEQGEETEEDNDL